MSSYVDKLRDPRWQRKRLEVFDRDNFSCVKCGNSEIELHVHHKFYDGREPWDYELISLETLCKLCHEKHHSNVQLNDADKIKIAGLRENIFRLRRLIPNTVYPSTGWIEFRLDKMTAELCDRLNREDGNG